MGKGDKRTKKGKRTMGSAGVSRPAKPKTKVVAAKPKKKAAPKKAVVAKKETAKKAVAKKAPAKKAAPKKTAAKK